jgi:hypothetical protein
MTIQSFPESITNGSAALILAGCWELPGCSAATDSKKPAAPAPKAAPKALPRKSGAPATGGARREQPADRIRDDDDHIAHDYDHDRSPRPDAHHDRHAYNRRPVRHTSRRHGGWYPCWRNGRMRMAQAAPRTRRSRARLRRAAMSMSPRAAARSAPDPVAGWRCARCQARDGCSPWPGRRPQSFDGAS